uniref:Uncharacterized protein n=1 Tax=Arundo donax TaxID=35708 RepID=A0A0A9EHC0_ARUDO
MWIHTDEWNCRIACAIIQWQITVLTEN